MSSDSHSAQSVTSPEELSPLAVEDRPPLPVSDGSVHEEPMDVVLSNAGDGEETPPPAAAVNAPVSAGGESKQFLTFISYDSDEEGVKLELVQKPRLITSSEGSAAPNKTVSEEVPPGSAIQTVSQLITLLRNQCPKPNMKTLPGPVQEPSANQP
ncbi:unnamed protein product [Heligmosomoides polygyrus]|uniref:Tumor protein p53 binding protein 1 n=1 Tax=Heligmosomoides polygyrus TaxID=6339 RepID=A0A183GHR3_HELPZ|nr:unnamed protein product [Heligmosomoides polygyrus]